MAQTRPYWQLPMPPRPAACSMEMMPTRPAQKTTSSSTSLARLALTPVPPGPVAVLMLPPGVACASVTAWRSPNPTDSFDASLEWGKLSPRHLRMAWRVVTPSPGFPLKPPGHQRSSGQHRWTPMWNYIELFGEAGNVPGWPQHHCCGRWDDGIADWLYRCPSGPGC